MAQNFGLNVEKNKALAAATGYTGDFGGGQFQTWMGQQPDTIKNNPAVQGLINMSSVPANSAPTTSTPALTAPVKQQNFGFNVERNKALAAATGYTGDFGGGQFEAWLNTPEGSKYKSGVANYTPTVSPAPAIAPATAIQDLNRGTVAGQINTLIAQDSPLMQRAAQSGLELAERRGLLNSGMAIGAAQNAVYDTAIPIAQSDAASANQFALTNAGELGLTNRFNAANIQQANLANLDAQQAIYMMSAQQRNDLAKMATAQGYNLENMSAQQINELAKMATLQKYNLENMSTQQINDLAKMATAQGYNLENMSVQQINDLAKISAQTNEQLRIDSARASTETALQILRGTQAQELSASEAKYRTQIQTSASAASFYSAIVQQMTNSQTATGTTQEQKDAAATYYNQALKNGMAIISAAGGESGTDLSSLLTFTGA